MNNKKIIYLILILVYCFFFSCEKDSVTDKPGFVLDSIDNISAEEYKIYSLVIDEYFTSSEIVIKQKTNSFSSIEKYNFVYYHLIDNNELLDSTLINNYIKINDSTYYFDNKFSCDSKKIILITDDEIDYYFGNIDINEAWGNFYIDYPNSAGIISFTRIGFNKTHTEALLETGITYASLGGFGNIVYLEKKNNNWIIVDKFGTWVS